MIVSKLCKVWIQSRSLKEHREVKKYLNLKKVIIFQMIMQLWGGIRNPLGAFVPPGFESLSLRHCFSVIFLKEFSY